MDLWELNFLVVAEDWWTFIYFKELTCFVPEQFCTEIEITLSVSSNKLTFQCSVSAGNGEITQPESGEFDDDDDDSEDDTVNVVIGDIRTAPQYSSLNIKRGGLLTTTGIPPQLKV